MSTETIRNVRDPVQDGHLNFHTAPDLCSLTLLYVQRDHKDYQGWPPRLCHSSWALNKESSSSVLFYVNRDQKDGLGRPPGLSHSSWALKVTSEQVSATNIPHPSAWAESKLWILLFQSRMVYAPGIAVCAGPCLSEVSPVLLLKQFQCCRSDWRLSFLNLILPKKFVEHYLSVYLSSRWSMVWWCPWLCTCR